MHNMRSFKHGRSILEELGSVLILAPHPDDEIIACSSIVCKAIQMDQVLRVILITSGEAHEAACTLLAARRAFIPLGHGLKGSAVRLLLGSCNKPEMYVLISFAGEQAAKVKVRLKGTSENTDWQPVNSLHYAVLKCPLGTLIPVVEISAEDQNYTVQAKKLVGKEDRRLLGITRIEESRAALEKLGYNTPPLCTHLGDGKVFEWWDLEKGRPAGTGISVFKELCRLAETLPEPAGLFIPSLYDRDLDHKGAAQMGTLLSRHLINNHHQASVFNYLVHHPGGEDHWDREGNAAGLPEFDIIEAVDVNLKSKALSCYKSQLQADTRGSFMNYAGSKEMFWHTTLSNLEKKGMSAHGIS